MKNGYTNEKGFSLVEVMIAAGMMGAAALGMMKMTENQTKMSKTTEAKNEIVMLSSEINSNLLDEDACLNTLSPVGDVRGVSSISFSEIKRSNGSTLVKLSTPGTTVTYGGRSL